MMRGDGGGEGSGWSGSGVWERSENRMWEVVPQDQEPIIPGRTRRDNTVVAELSIQGYLASFTQEDSTSGSSSNHSIQYHNDGFMLARIDLDRQQEEEQQQQQRQEEQQQEEQQQEQEAVFRTPSTSRRRRWKKRTGRRGPWENHAEARVESEEASTSGTSERGLGEGTSDSGRGNSNNSNNTPGSSYNSNSISGNYSNNNKRRWKPNRWWWKRKKNRIFFPNEGKNQQQSLCASVESSPGRDSPSPDSLRRILHLHKDIYNDIDSYDSNDYAKRCSYSHNSGQNENQYIVEPVSPVSPEYTAPQSPD